MVDVSGFIGTIEAIFDLTRGMINHRRDRHDNLRGRKDELVKLLISVEKAIAVSRKVLANRYDGDAKVEDLWEKVLELSVVLNDPNFIETATKKFEFWSYPEWYLNDPDLLSRVPQLEEFEKVCNDILRKLRTL